MSVSFADNWQDPTGVVVLDALTVTRILWQAADPVGWAARAKRGERLCRVVGVASPRHRLGDRSLQGTVMTVEVSGDKVEPGTFALHLGLVPENPMILGIAPIVSTAVIQPEPDDVEPE